MDDQTTRLNRIEEKLDKVSEAVISLARIEERMITILKRMDTHDTQQFQFSERLTKIEVAHAKSNGSSTWVDKIVMVIVAGAVSAVVFVSK